MDCKHCNNTRKVRGIGYMMTKCHHCDAPTQALIGIKATEKPKSEKAEAVTSEPRATNKELFTVRKESK